MMAYIKGQNMPLRLLLFLTITVIVYCKWYKQSVNSSTTTWD